MVFVATGTGIAPCRSFVRSSPGLEATVIHGVRVAEDLFYRDAFAAVSYVPCVSRDTRAEFHERVTDFIDTCRVPEQAHVYLCGAYAMIHDVTALLVRRGVAPEAIFTEPYYYATP
jgi:ferredoxin--NADP+ reductase/benzoate/toluate 1,2-dioxygenase reductase subunit